MHRNYWKILKLIQKVTFAVVVIYGHHCLPVMVWCLWNIDQCRR